MANLLEDVNAGPYMKKWIFGMDGGGTNSRIRVEDMTGTILHEGHGGSTNLHSNTIPEVAAVLLALLKGVLSAGLDPRGCVAGFIGSAGVDTDADTDTMTRTLRNSFQAAAEGRAQAPDVPAFGAANDTEPALAGALGDTEGFLLIAGTGSIAYGRTRSGKHARAGGWGHLLGDEGSAFWLAFEGIKRGIRSSEGRESESRLLAEALGHFELPDAGSLIPFTYESFGKARIASFAPRVTELANQGDAVALAILDQASIELADLVVSVHSKLAKDINRPRLALYGGLMEKNLPLKAAVTRRISTRIPGIELVEPVGDAQAGACMLARDLITRI